MGSDLLIISRSPRDLDAGLVSWLVTADNRGLALADCGCGLPLEGRIIRTWPRGHINPVVIEVVWFHMGNTRCAAGFDAKDFHPMTYVQYCQALGLDCEYEESGE